MGRERVKFATQYKKKKRFHGNQYTLNKKNSANTSLLLTDSQSSINVSNSKVNPINTFASSNKKNICGYRIIDSTLLAIVVQLLCCPECKTCRLNLAENAKKKFGLSSSLIIFCKCGFNHEFFTSKKCGSGSCRAFDINQRSVYAMRSCGQGHTGLKRFCYLMDLPPPMTKNTYIKIVRKIAIEVEAIAVETMSDAALEIIKASQHTTDEFNLINTSVSCDGTWQRRGFSSYNGVYTAISMITGKVLDCEVLSKYCKQCFLILKKKNTDPDAYKMLKNTHFCNLNYTGPSTGMEVAGAKSIFERSIEKYKLRYTEFCGDGDSKAFSSVERVYGDTIVSKLECVGHMQKRVGTRLRKLKKERCLGGKGRLTDATIDRLQNYYGIAVRTKNQSVHEMRSAILASLFHVASSKENNYHTYCPNGEKSWCQHNVDRKHPNQPSLYKPGPGLPRDIIELLKPIYKELSSNELLAKCMHGKTQNQNESLNMMIWERVPKTKFCSLLHLKFATYDAIANFNIGRKASVMTYEKLNMIPGTFMIDGCNKENKIRLYQSSYKNKSDVKLRRKTIRGNKKNKNDKEKQKQGTLYAAGSF